MQLSVFHAGQHSAFDCIVNAVTNKTEECFFLHGPGSTGKTYVYNTLCHYLHGQGKFVELKMIIDYSQLLSAVTNVI